MEIDKQVREINEYVLYETEKIINELLKNKEFFKNLEKTNSHIPMMIKYASPILITSIKEYIENYKEGSVLYLGQETNRWVNNKINNPSIEEIEKFYEQDVLENKGNGTGYWKLMDLDLLNKQKIIRSNMILRGRKIDSGPSYINDDLKRVYLEYFEFLYTYLNPKKIIISGCKDRPYNEIAKSLLQIVDSDINLDEMNNKEKILLSDSNKDIHCTYHGQYLLQTRKLEEVKKKIYKK